MGIIELPDNLPIVGNLDEFAASAILLRCLVAFATKSASQRRSCFGGIRTQLKHDASSR